MIEVEYNQSYKPPKKTISDRDMEVEISKKKSISSILKKLERYLSINKRKKSTTTTTTTTRRSKSWSSGERRKAAPVGCLSVYVGAEKQRFVMKAELVNHPLFKMLLEDAELEYGFNSDGPLLLPCHVDLFYKVLAEMECSDEISAHSPCGFSPARRRLGGTSYGLLRPVRSLKANHLQI